MVRRGILGMLLVGAILTVWAAPAHAQAIGSIFGKVTDSSGAVLPGVTITVAGTGLQQPLMATTTENGSYEFPSVPIGTYTVTFELASFKKAVRQNVIITSGFNAGIDQRMELGQMQEEVTVSAASPVVDLKKTITGATFDADILDKIPTARDPWQIINMTPGVQLSGYNVGGSASGQQLTPSVRGSTANVQWNLEGGSITDLSSNSSPMYFNFDSFEQIQVTTGGGDVSVQSAGLAINLITKSGSNVFKGTFNGTFENDKTQGSNVSRDQFERGAGGFLSGNPLNRIAVYSVEAGGPVVKDRLWYWGAWDHQDINTGVLNFFDPAKGGLCADLADAQASGADLGIAYDNLNEVQRCLKNDKTVIKDVQAKANYQLNAANKFGYLFISNDKIRNARGASASTATEATTQQYGPKGWGFANPTHQVQHTLIATDKLVFNNQFTYVGGGFNLDYQDFERCGKSEYLGATDPAAYLIGGRTNSDCLWNIQSLNIRTTSYNSRSLEASYQTKRPTWEAKTDGTYFLTNFLGGNHSLKFGAGWRRAPILSFSHYSGGARARLQCVDNDDEKCGNGQRVAVGSAAGLVPYRAVLYRDQLRNNDWWTYNGYLQDSYSKSRWRVNGGLRYDWQQSKHLGGCVPANQLRPDLLPAQCEDETDKDPATGRRIQSFGNWSPRLSVTYDLLGDGKTSLRASGSYYYQTKITLANNLTGLTTTTSLTWSNLSSGACSTRAGTGCWTDANMDSIVQPGELTGIPSASSTRFQDGVLVPTGNIVHESAKIGRTREAIVGAQHELIANLAVGVDYIYRKYDRGTATYTLGFEPGAPGFPLSQIYVGPIIYTDPVTGLSAPYYEVCATCTRPSGAAQITMTNPNYQVYQGVDITATKRYSSRWQLQSSLTIQTNPQYFPEGSTTFINPTGREFRHGYSTVARYVFKANGSYTLPWEINASANLNITEGANRTRSIDGPGDAFGGVGQTRLSGNNQPYDELEFEPRGSTRYEPVKLLDLGLQKAFRFANSRYQLRLMFDAFNVFNINTIIDYDDDNMSVVGFTQPTRIIPPRVFRVGTRITF